MRKIFFAFGMLVALFASQAMAQSIVPGPSCSNDQALENMIDAIENQGWVETSRAFAVIDYFVQPDPPYVAGFLTVTFQVDCDPGEPCPEILRVANFNQIVTNDKGNCHWQKDNPQANN